MAADVPRMVAKIEDDKVILIVVARALIMSSLDVRLMYHLKVNPPQTVRDIELLNDKTISTIIGAYKNKNTSPR